MIPKYLYHYTSINGLKEIVSSKKIRFKRLDKLNDPYEGFFTINDVPEHIKELRKFVYVSCWNDQNIDSISLWYIYTKMNGVRIKMKTSLFGESLRLDEYSNCFIPACTIPKIPIVIKGLNMGVDICNVFGPIKIVYTCLEDTYKYTFEILKKDESQTYRDDDIYNIYLRELGMCKVMHWNYENEWRYKINLFGQLQGSKDVIVSEFRDLYPPEYLDIPYNQEIDEVLTAPNMSERDINDIISFFKKKNIDTCVQRSEIQIST